MAKKSAIQVEVDRINKYVKEQRRKYGSSLVVPNESTPEYIIGKYKSTRTQLKKLRELTTLKLKGQMKMMDWDTAEYMSLREYQSKQKSKAQREAVKRKKAQEQAWEELYNQSEEDEPYYPSKEEIELNNLGEEMASVTGETWNYQEYSLANYKEIMRIGDNELKHSRDERLNIAILVNEWLQNLVDQFGLATVAKMLNEGIGSNSITRNEIYYDGQQALDFMYRMMDYLPIDSDLKQEIMSNLLGSIDLKDIGIYD